MRKIVCERQNKTWFTKRQWELIWLMNTSFVEGADKRKERSQKILEKKEIPGSGEETRAGWHLESISLAS